MYPRPPPLQRQLVIPRRPSLRRESALLGALANARFELEKERELRKLERKRIKQLEKQVNGLLCGRHG